MTTWRNWALVMALCLTVTAPAVAQTQLELTMQARKAAEAADKRLNDAYQKLLKRLDPDARAKLLKAEVAWIAFRDGQCLFEGDWYRGGSASPYQYNLCLKRMTDARIKELEEALAFHDGN